MATDVAVLIARLEADVRDFDKDLKKATKRLGKLEKATGKAGAATDKTTTSFGGMGKMMGVVFAGAAAAAAFKFFKGMVNDAVDLNESINAVNVVFGDAAEGVLKLGENAADSMGLANAEFNSLAVSFSAFVEKIAGPGGDVVATLEELTTRASDFASVMNIDVAEAATIFKSALAGETESIRKFGVDVSAAAVAQEALALGLGEGSDALSEQDKILARYKLIMDQTEKTAGDFANTQDELANALRRLNSKITDAKARIGKFLIPALEDLIPAGEAAIEIFVRMGIELADAFGLLSPAEAALARFDVQVGHNAEGLAGLLTVVEHTRGAIVPFTSEVDKTGKVIEVSAERAALLESEMLKLVDTVDFTAADLAKLREEGFDPAALGMKLTADEAAFLADLMEHKLNVSINQTAQHLKEDLEDALNDVEHQAHDTAEEIDNVADALLALTSPAFKAVRLQEKLAEAVLATTVAETNFGAGSAEHVEALLAELETSLALDAANEDLINSDVDLIAKVLELAEAHGLDTDQLLILEEAMGKVSGSNPFTPAHFENARKFQEAMGEAEAAVIRVTTAIMNVPVGFGSGGEGFAFITPRNISPFHQGGIVPGPPGADVPIVAQAGERIIPATQVAQVAQVAQVGTGDGGGDINITIEGDLTEPVFEDLQRELILESIGRFVETR